MRERELFLENRECTLIVSSQLKVASVISSKMALVAHLVSGSHFWDIFGSGVLGVADPDFFPDIFGSALEGVRGGVQGLLSRGVKCGEPAISRPRTVVRCHIAERCVVLRRPIKNACEMPHPLQHWMGTGTGEGESKCWMCNLFMNSK